MTRPPPITTPFNAALTLSVSDALADLGGIVSELKIPLAEFIAVLDAHDQPIENSQA